MVTSDVHFFQDAGVVLGSCAVEPGGLYVKKPTTCNGVLL